MGEVEGNTAGTQLEQSYSVVCAALWQLIDTCECPFHQDFSVGTG